MQHEDTLHTIMKKYNLSKQTIKRLNPHIANPEILTKGMKVKIASSTKPIDRQQTPLTTTAIQIEKQQKELSTSERVIRHPQSHQRPMGESIQYDQQMNMDTNKVMEKYNKEEQEAIVAGICCHCRQPIYLSRPPFISKN